MKQYGLENHWRDLVLEKLKKRPGIKAAKEVAVFGRQIDLLYSCRGQLTAVEFKIEKWRDAMVQARKHHLIADRTYVCLPSKLAIDDKVISHAISMGVGVMASDKIPISSYRIVVRAPKSRFVWAPGKKMLRKALLLKK